MRSRLYALRRNTHRHLPELAICDLVRQESSDGLGFTTPYGMGIIKSLVRTSGGRDGGPLVVSSRSMLMISPGSVCEYRAVLTPCFSACVQAHVHRQRKQWLKRHVPSGSKFFDTIWRELVLIEAPCPFIPNLVGAKIHIRRESAS